MKYNLPWDLKLHYFYCEKFLAAGSYRICKRRCPQTYRQCWERHLREDLATDCAIDNERKARSYVTCYNCGSICDIGTGFNRFLCDNCGAVVTCELEEQKELMGDEYIEIDQNELNEALKAIK